jgi:hypothetical protein
MASGSRPRYWGRPDVERVGRQFGVAGGEGAGPSAVSDRKGQSRRHLGERLSKQMLCRSGIGDGRSIGIQLD